MTAVWIGLKLIGMFAALLLVASLLVLWVWLDDDWPR